MFVLLALMLAPFAPWLRHFDYTMNWYSGVPKGSEALANYMALRNSFGAAVRPRSVEGRAAPDTARARLARPRRLRRKGVPGSLIRR